MSDDLMKSLEALEQSAEADGEEGDTALDLVEEIAKSKAGLNRLVARFSSTPTVTIARALSFVLAQKANSPTTESCNAVYEFIGKLKQHDDASTLMNALTAIQRQVIADMPWTPVEKTPREMFQLLVHALSQADVVQSNALRVLTALGESGLISKAFSGGELDALRAKVAEIEKLHDPVLEEGIRRLPDALRS